MRKRDGLCVGMLRHASGRTVLSACSHDSDLHRAPQALPAPKAGTSKFACASTVLNCVRSFRALPGTWWQGSLAQANLIDGCHRAGGRPQRADLLRRRTSPGVRPLTWRGARARSRCLLMTYWALLLAIPRRRGGHTVAVTSHDRPNLAVADHLATPLGHRSVERRTLPYSSR